MKTFKILTGVMLILISFSSCKKLLDLTPEDYFGEGNYWQNETQVSTFMNGMHNQFRGNQFQFYRLGEMRGGSLATVNIMPVSLNELNVIQQNLSETSTGIGSWAGFYNPILQINLFISKVEPITYIEANRKNYLLGQAYALRAFYYFHLLRTYGGVPLRLLPDVTTDKPDQVKLRLARSSEAEVLAQVKADVNKSLEYFGSQASVDKTQWNPNAARMLKGEVYLWSAKVYNNTADLADAKNALNAITGYSLPGFANTFTTKGNGEIIFAIRNVVGETEMPVSGFLYDQPNFNTQYFPDSSGTSTAFNDPLNIATVNSSGGIQRYMYSFDLYKSYKAGDTRRDATFMAYYGIKKNSNPVEVTARGTILTKFMGEINANKRYWTSDWPIYREADRQLMLAEITNAEGGNPGPYIQAVRNRAFNNADPTPFVNGSKDQNELAIFEERSKEFVWEGKRWYDLRRMKFAGEPMVFKSASQPYGVINKATEPFKVLWPIETAIWTNDPLVDQTPGYQTSKP